MKKPIRNTTVRRKTNAGNGCQTNTVKKGKREEDWRGKKMVRKLKKRIQNFKSKQTWAIHKKRNIIIILFEKKVNTMEKFIKLQQMKKYKNP